MKKMLFALACAAALLGAGDLSAATLEEGFACPPDAAKPWCYWWWGEGEGVSNVENGGSFTKFTFPLYSSKLTSSEVW